MYIVKIIRVFESGSNVFWLHPTIHCYWCDKILKYLGCFYLELLARWWFYVLRYSRLLQNMQIKWSKPSSREKGWFPRTSYSTSATRNPQQISKARHLLSLILAANTTGKNWMILSVMLLDILRRVWCCFQPCLIHLIWSQLSAAHKLDQRRQLWFKTKGNNSNSTGLSLLTFTFSRICVFFSWQLGQWLFKCTVFFVIGNYHFFLDGNV